VAGEVLSKSVVRPVNWTSVYLIAVALGLTMLGLVMLFSAGVVKDAHSLLTKQIIWIGLSVMIALYISFMDLEWLKQRSWWIFGFCILGLVLTLVPGVGVKVNGAQRWIGLGPLRVQPSEFAKIGLVFALAAFFSSNQREIKTFF